MKTKNIISLCLASTFLLFGGIASQSFGAAKEVKAAAHQTNFDDYTYSGDYYEDISGTGNSLREQLTSLILPKAWYTYGGGGSDHLSTILQYADEDPENPSNMIYYYTRDSVKKNAASSWNREHVWPQNDSNNCWGTGSGAGSDLLHIRPTYNDTNNKRGNDSYGNTDGAVVTYQGMTYGKKGSNVFEPLDCVKGDAARICMYVWVAYYNYYGTKLPALTKVFTDFNTMMEWHIADKPDVLEGNRNDYSEKSIQKNRNPFVDHPEYAWQIFGDKCSSDVLEAAKKAYPVGPAPDPVAVTGVSLNQTSGTINIGDTLNLTATVTPSNATNKKVTWSTSDSSVATVNNGAVKGVKAGSTTITVATVDGNKTATCNVTVNSVPVTGVTLNKTSLTIEEGQTSTLVATVAPTNATNKNVTWSSSDSTVASVSSSGVVTAVKKGTATITVTTVDGDKTATCDVTVNEKSVTPIAVTGVSLNKTSLSLKEGDSETLIETVSPENASNKNVTWSSSNTSIVTVNNGVVSAHHEGNATITVTTVDGNKTATCNVTVSKDGGDTPTTGTLVRIKLGSLPTKREYKGGEELDLSGMVIIAIYDNGQTKDVTSSVIVAKPDMSKAGDVGVKVSYIEGDIIVSLNFLIIITSNASSGGCGGSIIASSALISLTSILGVGLLFLKKKNK